MPLLDILITGVGSAIAKGLVKLWLKDAPVLLTATDTTASILARHFQDIRQQREAERQFGRIAERAADSVLQLLDKEGGDLSDSQREVIANAAAETIKQTPISASLLAKHRLEPTELAAHFNARSGSEGGNPLEFAGEAEVALYKRILFHASELIVDIAGQFPRFNESVAAQLLEGQNVLTIRAEQIIDGMERILAAQAGTDLDDERFETDFRNACKRAFDHLELFGVDLDESNRRYKLSVAYVTLEVEQCKVRTSETAIPLEADSSTPGPGTAVLAVDEALARAPRLFVRGPAGSGKTTLMQWLAVFAAGRELKGELEPLNDCVPFLIKLRDLADQSRLPSPEDFAGLVSSALGGEPHQWAHRRLKAGRALVLVDGLDEAMENQREKIKRWLEDLTDQYPDSRFVVTSRPHAAREGWLDQATFVDAELQALRRTEIHRFIDHWHEAVADGVRDPDRRTGLSRLADSLKQRVDRTPSLRRLSNSPLLCAILCALHRDREEQLPTDRLELYRACIAMFFRRDREKKVLMGDYVELSDSQALRLLQHLAWWMIRNGRSSARPDEIAERLEQDLERLTKRPLGADGVAVERLFVERVGILRQLSANKIDFPHRTFQEYLAAHAAIAEKDADLLVHNAHDDQWREVAIMAAGLQQDPEKTEAFIRQLIERGVQEKARRQVLYLVAASAFETVEVLPPGSDLPGVITDSLSEIVPPTSITAAKQLAKAGDLVAPLLARRKSWYAAEAAASIRTLAQIGTELAAITLRSWLKDRRRSAIDEIVRVLLEGEKDFRKLVFNDPSVTALDLTGSKIIDLGVLSSLTALESLNLSWTQVDSLGALSSCTALKKLNLSGTIVSDLKPLAELRALEELQLWRTRVQDLEPLSKCSALRILDISNTAISDLTPIGQCTSLDELDVSHTQVHDLRPLTKCIALKVLRVGHTEVTDLGPLAKCIALSIFDLGHTEVTDLAPLAGCAALETLDISNTLVSNLEPLAEMKGLQLLHVSGKSISNIEPLEHCLSLKYLMIFQTNTSSESIKKLREKFGDELVIWGG